MLVIVTVAIITMMVILSILKDAPRTPVSPQQFMRRKLHFEALDELSFLVFLGMKTAFEKPEIQNGTARNQLQNPKGLRFSTLMVRKCTQSRLVKPRFLFLCRHFESDESAVRLRRRNYNEPLALRTTLSH